MKNVLNGVKSACGKAWDFTVGVLTPAVQAGKSIVASPMAWFVLVSAAVFMFLGGGDLLAQTTLEKVEVQELVDWDITNLVKELIKVIGKVVAGIVGLGLTIWACRYVFSLIKTMGR